MRGTQTVGIAACLGTLLLTGCTSLTPYQPLTADMKGYAEKRIDEGTYFVQFFGSSPVISPYDLIYRCAELTKQAGYQNFTVIPQAPVSNTGFGNTMTRGGSFDRAMMRQVHAVPTMIFIPVPGSGAPAMAPTPKPLAYIRMFNDADLRQRTVGWSAQEVLDQLGDYVKAPDRQTMALPQPWVFEPGKPRVRGFDNFPYPPQTAVPPVHSAS
jgi:hypothetical protein